MDITYYFGKKNDTNVEEKKNKKDKIKLIFMNIISKLIELSIIDMLDYSHILNFIKSGGTIVGMARYMQINNKIINSQADDKLKTQFQNVSKKLFSHLYDLIDLDNNTINISYILDNIKTHSSEYLEFTNDQIEGIKHICTFLYSSEVKTFGLYGYAGTGKTTLITKLVNFLVCKNYINSIVFCAPTNKAVNIIKSKFTVDIDQVLNNKFSTNKKMSFNDQLDKLNEVGSNIDFLTIHKLLDFQNDFDTSGERIFIKTGKKTDLTKYDLIIIDECSMIPLNIIFTIFEEIRDNTQNDIIKKIPKILFVGDPAQLPPVNETVSIIFADKFNDFNLILLKKLLETKTNANSQFIKNRDTYIDSCIKEFTNEILNQKSITLEKIIRSSNDKVIGICNEIRHWVFDIIKDPKIGTYKGEKVKIYRYNKEPKTETKWLQNCVSYFKNNIDQASIILTWTNRQADVYNNYIRKTIFNKDKLNDYEIGDVLILNDFYNIKESDIDTKIKRFYTSEQIKVTDIEEVIKVASDIIITIPNQIRKLKNSNLIEEKLKNTILNIHKSTNKKYKAWKLYVHKLTDSLMKDIIPEIYQIYVLKKESYNTLEKDKIISMEKIKTLRNYYNSNYKDHMNIIDKCIIKPLWKEWSKSFVEQFAEVNYGTAITVHKSQGSTYFNVFVDTDDILNNNSKNEAKRCIYTALTRTSNEIHILI